MVLSTVNNPVTVVAEVDVNKAVIQEMGCSVEAGNFSKRVPIRIVIVKRSARNCGGLRGLLFLCVANGITPRMS